VGEKDATVPEGEGAGADAKAADLEGATSRTSRLQRRLRALKRRQRQPETNTPLKLMTTDELRRALNLVERGGVLPSGDVRRPDVFRSASLEESEALERWRQLCGEPLDHLEAAEELLDRVGEADGWYSRGAVQAALLLTRLELPDATPWFVGKRAETILNLYAELEEHRDEPQHPHVRGAVRHLERLKRMSHHPPDPEATSESFEDEHLESLKRSSGGPQSTAGPRPPDPESHPPAAQEASEGPRAPWWRRIFGG
jgi:hypothetical protein